jgi:hypothetical protein
VTPSADELPAPTSIIVRLSQNGLVALALFYALVLGTALPLGALARAAIDRFERLDLFVRSSSLALPSSLDQIRDVGTRGDDLGARRAQLDQESGAITVDELESSEVETAPRAIGVRRDERSQLRDPRTHEATLEADERATVGINLGNPQHEESCSKGRARACPHQHGLGMEMKGRTATRSGPPPPIAG